MVGRDARGAEWGTDTRAWEMQAQVMQDADSALRELLPPHGCCATPWSPGIERRALAKLLAFGTARPYYSYARSEFRFDGLRDPEYSGPTTI